MHFLVNFFNSDRIFPIQARLRGCCPMFQCSRQGPGCFCGSSSSSVQSTLGSWSSTIRDMSGLSRMPKGTRNNVCRKSFWCRCMHLVYIHRYIHEERNGHHISMARHALKEKRNKIVVIIKSQGLATHTIPRHIIAFPILPILEKAIILEVFINCTANLIGTTYLWNRI